jgi:hypothetical protein
VERTKRRPLHIRKKSVNRNGSYSDREIAHNQIHPAVRCGSARHVDISGQQDIAPASHHYAPEQSLSRMTKQHRTTLEEAHGERTAGSR